jgi:hypothetical protein
VWGSKGHVIDAEKLIINLLPEVISPPLFQNETCSSEYFNETKI